MTKKFFLSTLITDVKSTANPQILGFGRQPWIVQTWDNDNEDQILLFYSFVLFGEERRAKEFVNLSKAFNVFYYKKYAIIKKKNSALFKMDGV